MINSQSTFAQLPSPNGSSNPKITMPTLTIAQATKTKTKPYKDFVAAVLAKLKTADSPAEIIDIKPPIIINRTVINPTISTK